MLYYLVDGAEVGGGGGAWNTGVPVTGVFLFTGDCITHTHTQAHRERDRHTWGSEPHYCYSTHRVGHYQKCEYSQYSPTLKPSCFLRRPRHINIVEGHTV